MHYKNGKRARTGDLILFAHWSGLLALGHVTKTIPEVETCNLHVLPVGASINDVQLVNAKDVILAEDAVAAVDALQNVAAVAKAPPVHMRAKLKVDAVTNHGGSETLEFSAVCAPKFGEDGSDENNSFARWTPSAFLRMLVANPALVGSLGKGDEVYLDFTVASKVPGRPATAEELADATPPEAAQEANGTGPGA